MSDLREAYGRGMKDGRSGKESYGIAAVTSGTFTVVWNGSGIAQITL